MCIRDSFCLSFPMEIATYFHYCRSLRFNDRPDYGVLKKMMRELMYREALKYDFLYDWTSLDPTSHLQKESSVKIYRDSSVNLENKLEPAEVEAKTEEKKLLLINLEEEFKDNKRIGEKEEEKKIEEFPKELHLNLVDDSPPKEETSPINTLKAKLKLLPELKEETFT
eukprot:TRINITY_DN9801_c0_g6_i1.p1 TRINITY_DN9801_c0_g6~~TRINITY_DN9801_c0_g6_i1.p1  ORF type:complete len:168 (-),score=65.30 TRINITY_DN9801_c0_g6_i1:83-586(-)